MYQHDNAPVPKAQSMKFSMNDVEALKWGLDVNPTEPLLGGTGMPTAPQAASSDISA